MIANKSILERKIDRTVINVSNIISASGGNAIDVLEQTPGISVDRENLTISVLGKNGINLMINGRMNYLPSDAIGPFLAGINADNIDAILSVQTDTFAQMDGDRCDYIPQFYVEIPDISGCVSKSSISSVNLLDTLSPVTPIIEDILFPFEVSQIN